MFGEKLKFVIVRCCVCEKLTALRLDPEDLERHRKKGVFVKNAFVDRAGRPYLTAGERELFVSQCCPDCWRLLCPSDPIAYN